jgi:hypothetical protein
MITSTERYDGKSRKDDIRKWSIIVGIVVILFVGLQIGLHFLKKATAADYTVVDMCDGRLTEAVQEHIKQITGGVVGDKNENGNVKVSIKSIMSGYMSDYTESAAAMFTGDYVLFFMIDPAPWDEDILAEKIDLTGTPLWEEWATTNSEMHLYACILNTNDKDMEEAQNIVDAILNEEASD